MTAIDSASSEGGNGLNEFEYLTLSDDTCRQGALRFLDDKGEVIRGKAADAVPRLVDLETITAIARAYEQGKEISPEEMQALAGAGGSGGARPKANVRDGDALWLAKFTSVHDQQPIERVEVATLRLAAACGTLRAAFRPGGQGKAGRLPTLGCTSGSCFAGSDLKPGQERL